MAGAELIALEALAYDAMRLPHFGWRDKIFRRLSC